MSRPLPTKQERVWINPRRQSRSSRSGNPALPRPRSSNAAILLRKATDAFLGGLVVLSCGCSAKVPADAAASGPAPPPRAGGAVECADDAECAAVARGNLETLLRRSSVAQPYVSTRCTRVLIPEGFRAGCWDCAVGVPSCVCALDSQASSGRADTISPSSSCDCAVWTPLGECLYRVSEFPGCDLNAPDSCAMICSDLEALKQQAAARSLEASLRVARCERGACRWVGAIGARCYAGPGLFSSPYDCSLGNDEILKRAQARHTHVCTSSGCQLPFVCPYDNFSFGG